MRNFATTSAACYPRQKPGQHRRAPSQGYIPFPDQFNPIGDATPVPKNELAKAQSDGAIFEFSPEAIDALASQIRQSSIADAPPPPERTSSRKKIGNEPVPTIKPAQEELGRFKGSKTTNSKGFKESEDNVWTEESPKEKEPWMEPWMIQKNALKDKFPEGWRSRKRLSPDALDGIRALHAQFPEQYTTPVLADQFKVSPEVIRRILKSKWRPSPEEDIKRQERWFNRGKNVWSNMVSLGFKAPKVWRREGIVREPSWNRKTGPRNYWPYVARRPSEEDEDQDEEKSSQRKLGKNLL